MMKLVKIWVYIDFPETATEGWIRERVFECWSGIKQAFRENDLKVDRDIENVEIE